MTEFFIGNSQARHGDWKAVTIKPNKPLELYNLREDPEEKHDLAKKYPEMVIGFDKVMKEMRTPSENWPIPEDAESGKSNWLCKTEGVSWTYDIPSVFYPFFQDITVFKRRVLQQRVGCRICIEQPA